MTVPPFYFVTLSHGLWEDALACARRLPPEALPELRLDLFAEAEPEPMIRALGRRCLVTCRRASEGGAWSGSEAERLDRLLLAAQSRPAWLDLEWELAVPEPLRQLRSHIRLLRSVHVPPGVFDLEQRLQDLPEGDAYKWVGHAGRLEDNARVRPALAWARDRKLFLSAFLMGPKGLPSRCLQAAWGGAFSYAAPDDGPPAAPGQLALATMLGFRCHRLHSGYGLCGVLGQPVLHSLGPAYHNQRFQEAFKDLLYLPLDCADPDEALAAMAALELLGVSLTAPLKSSVPARLGLAGPRNTLFRRTPQAPWTSANTDADALDAALDQLAPGPVLVLGDGGVAATSQARLDQRQLPWLACSRRQPVTAEAVRALAPIGVIQATGLGMAPGDPLPFPEALAAAEPSVAWGIEWIYKEDTAFAAWAGAGGRRLVTGASLFQGQAARQSATFIAQCGG